MNSDRIREIQKETAYPDSVSVKQALLQVWNECEQSKNDDESIDYHLKRIKAIQGSNNQNGFIKEKGKLMARVFIRATGATNDGKGNYIIPSDDIFAWFENGDYLMQKTEWDAM